MATTIQAVVDRARMPLNDSAKVRISDESLAIYVVSGLLLLYERRSDLFFDAYATPPALTLTKNDNLPVADTYVQPLADYATARAEGHEDEAAIAQKAPAFYALFTARI